MTIERIEDFQRLTTVVQETIGNTVFLDTWVPQDKFLYAISRDSSITIIREDEGEFGFSFGRNPFLPESCSRFSIERKGEYLLTSTFEIKARWDVYTKLINAGSETVNSSKEFTDLEIKEFLELHAPDSSVMPGNPEIVRWATLAYEDRLVGVAAICRWESGRFVVASVATDSKMRGQGFGAKIMEEVHRLAFQEGIDRLSLGVRAENAHAKRLYERSGYGLLHEFTYIERI